MQERFYDVVVVGRSLGALVTAALLARRDFTVLVVGQGRRSANYAFDGYSLRRRSFTMLAAATPSWTRVVRDLAYTQTWRRQIHTLSPMVQFALVDRRFEIPADGDLFEREVEREFPALRRLISELYTDFSRVTAAADDAFAREAMWPPGSFFERRETARVAAKLPYARGEQHHDLLAEFPLAHPYRAMVAESVQFATDLATPPPAFAAARLHGAWTRGVHRVEGGEDTLERMLLERVMAHGGQCRLEDRCVAVATRRGGVSRVQLDGEDGPTGAGFVITDMTGEELAGLAGDQGISQRAQRAWPRLRAPVGRFVVSIIVDRAAIPAPLAPEVFFIDEADAPTIHLQRLAEQRDAVLLVAEMLLGERSSIPLRECRAYILSRLVRALPFLSQHLRVVDSVHDGLPLWRYDESGRRQEVDRAQTPDVSARPESLVPQFDVDPPGYLGLAGEPLRGPIDHTLLVGPSVMPALGQEGSILAAWSAARLVTKRDRRRARRRGDMWTKIEIT
jgi:phytoene dehydrogenase-like protein